MNFLPIITELQALSQAGLEFAKDPFDRERYQRFLEIGADMAAQLSGKNYDEVLKLFATDTGYRTPKIDVRAAAFKGNKILLVREKEDDLWSLPGGWADINLGAVENALKEMKEEAGQECRVIKLIAVHDKFKRNLPGLRPHVYKMFFLCEIIEGAFSESEEISESDFFALDELPQLSQARVSEKQIKMCFAHHYKPTLPTEFD